MKVSELMAGHTPDPTFEGITNTDDYVLAVDFTGKASDPGEFLVAQEGITEHSGALEAETQDARFIRGGKQNIKTGTQRTFTLSGSRYIGDDFQDALMAHELKYGTGKSVIKPFVYFNLLTGKGERGLISIAVESDPSGAAGENAGISATLSANGTPTEYTYINP